MTVHGGPDTPKYLGDVERWFQQHPHVDVAVHGEGEATFTEMLAVLADQAPGGPIDLAGLGDVAGLSFRHGDRVVQTAPRDRIADINTIPSPTLTGLFDGFIPAGGDQGGVLLETNRGCPYGCTFCDWGSATLSRIRQFDLERVFAELEWSASNQFGVGLADANFGIFERDVEIAQRIADLKAQHGFPKVVGNNYAKNTVKHLSKIIEIFTQAGIVAEGKMSMQTFDTDTLLTIRRKNIKVEKYHDLAVEFRRNHLPLAIELMIGLPGSTPATFRADLQSGHRPGCPGGRLSHPAAAEQPDERTGLSSGERDRGPARRAGRADLHLHAVRVRRHAPAAERLLRVRELRRAALCGDLPPPPDRRPGDRFLRSTPARRPRRPRGLAHAVPSPSRCVRR